MDPFFLCWWLHPSLPGIGSYAPFLGTGFTLIFGTVVRMGLAVKSRICPKQQLKGGEDRRWDVRLIFSRNVVPMEYGVAHSFSGFPLTHLRLLLLLLRAKFRSGLALWCSMFSTV